MKKLLLSFVAAMAFSAAATAQVGYGIRAGLNVGQLAARYDGTTETTDALTSFHVTAFVDAPLAQNFSFQPGLSLQSKGGKEQEDGESVSFSFLYLEVPLNFVYNIPAGAGNVFFGAGPYVGYGANGSLSVGGVSVDLFSSQSSDSFGFSFKRFDAGINALSGYRFDNGLLFNVGYGQGLMNMIDWQNVDIKMTNRTLSFGVGYQF